MLNTGTSGSGQCEVILGYFIISTLVTVLRSLVLSRGVSETALRFYEEPVA